MANTIFLHFFLSFFDFFGCVSVWYWLKALLGGGGSCGVCGGCDDEGVDGDGQRDQ